MTADFFDVSNHNIYNAHQLDGTHVLQGVLDICSHLNLSSDEDARRIGVPEYALGYFGLRQDLAPLLHAPARGFSAEAVDGFLAYVCVSFRRLCIFRAR
jgi:hypothetical protein